VIEYADKKSGKKGVLFDANAAKSVPKTVLPESEQEENESRRWVRVLRLFHCHKSSPDAVDMSPCLRASISIS
jgi:hypothetical protein